MCGSVNRSSAKVDVGLRSKIVTGDHATVALKAEPSARGRETRADWH